MSTQRQRTIQREDLSGACLVPGDVLDGRYRIERILGEGTFAWVYLARHATISTLQCAIKVLKPHFVGDEELRHQFRHEAETVARLRDRHTVRVSDMGELPDGRPYICMEYCIGATLDRILGRLGAQPDAVVAHIGRGVLHSLREAHNAGIVHRDIKPSNISLTEDASSSAPLTRVLDFGIAYVAQAQGLADANHESDLVFCTPSYAAPEVLRGDVTPPADLYALGLTLAELLEGEPVFANTGFYTVAARQMADEPVPFGPRTRRSALLPVLQKACEKKREHRFRTAGEMLAALEAVASTLTEPDTLTWSYYQPDNCVGVTRCSLAANRLDMTLPAGCAMAGCAAGCGRTLERKIDDSASAPLAFDRLTTPDVRAMEDEDDDAIDMFLTSEFVDAPLAPSTTGQERVAEDTGGFDALRALTPPHGLRIPALHTETPAAVYGDDLGGTMMTRRMATDNAHTYAQDGPSPAAAIEEARPLERGHRLPDVPRWALALANITLTLVFLTLFLRLLLFGFP